jgi:plastocyanin
MVNGCTSATAIDKTAATTVTINFGADGGISYEPACVRIKTGTSVTFSGDFMVHPLQGGTATGSRLTPDPASPIPATSTGMTATAMFPNAGTFPYYCTMHGSFGMAGAIFVE